jgi:hypothetical protein
MTPFKTSKVKEIEMGYRYPFASLHAGSELPGLGVALCFVILFIGVIGSCKMSADVPDSSLKATQSPTSIIANTTNVFAQPLQGEKVCKLKTNTPIIVKSNNGSWAYIKTETCKGYVRSSSIKYK